MVVTFELIRTTIPSQSQENTRGNITVGQKIRTYSSGFTSENKVFKKYKQEDMK